jgi:hypothetical protein
MTTPSLLLMLFACEPQEPAVEPGLLSPRKQLLRLSVDLRGVHPTEEELVAIEAHPYLYEDYVDRYLEDPRFLERIRQIFNHRYLTRTGSTYEQTVQGASSAQVAEAIGEEPLRLLTYVVENDLPFTTMLTADFTMANPLLAEVWDIQLGGEGQEWQPAHYEDSRPHAGILSMNAIWQRYPSMGGNANRHRANAVSKMLLCDDYLARPVVLNRAAVDQLTISPEDAINTNPSCQSCHSTLDPLAAHFFGFFPRDEEEDTTIYYPEREEGWRDYAEKEPAYYGIPTANLTELGAAMAEDPRFVDCAVQTVLEVLEQRSVGENDWSIFQEHREAFEASELSVRHLVRSVVMGESYLLEQIEDPEIAEVMPTVKVVNPYQLSSIMKDITGFQWSFNGVDALTDNGMGIPVLLGGLDSATVTERNYQPSVGLVFVQERLAQSAGWHVASHDLDPDREGDAILLKYVNRLDTPESAPERFRAQIQHLYLRATGQSENITQAEVTELMHIWDRLHSVRASPTQAWAGVVSAVLRDPAIITY